MPENAPTDIKPAWPSDSSPRIPTVRLSETAITTYAQIGTSRLSSRLETMPNERSTCMTAKAMMTMPNENQRIAPRFGGGILFQFLHVFRPLKPFR